MTVFSVDPRTGAAAGPVATEATAAGIGAACRGAAAAAPGLAAAGPAGRAAALRRAASALEADGQAIVALGDREAALGERRLHGELGRAAGQFRLFAEAVEEGSYLEASLDSPASLPAGRRPDLRRMLIPVGPVAVFGASNFPLAFSVPGGDTASALAAGCPVVVKAHPSHPATSQRCQQVLAAALSAAGLPDGCLSVVHGLQAGAQLVAHPGIRAVAFTGSPRGGRALHDIAVSRPDPIPFYGELGSLNPVVVLPGAAQRGGPSIAAALAASFTAGAGQFCTKPGLVLVPAGAAGDALAGAMAAAVSRLPAEIMLSDIIRDAYARGLALRSALPGVTVLATGSGGPGRGGVPALLSAEARCHLDRQLLAECFGPVTVLLRYDGQENLLAVLAQLDGALTGTIHASQDEAGSAATVARALGPRVGRLIFNGVPTGVAVSWSMHHGGPYPATTSLHTSVGTTALRRFLRPICFQDAPEELLPGELRSDNPLGLPRRVDGRLQPATAPRAAAHSPPG